MCGLLLRTHSKIGVSTRSRSAARPWPLIQPINAGSAVFDRRPRARARARLFNAGRGRKVASAAGRTRPRFLVRRSMKRWLAGGRGMSAIPSLCLMVGCAAARMRRAVARAFLQAARLHAALNRTGGKPPGMACPFVWYMPCCRHSRRCIGIVPSLPIGSSTG